MSITETSVDVPAKKKPRKKRRKARAAAPKAPAAIHVPTEYAGLTVTDCCKACSADGCVISGSNYCAHPRKGCLQGRDMHDARAIDRLNKARKMLASADADKRFS